MHSMNILLNIYMYIVNNTNTKYSHSIGGKKKLVYITINICDREE